MGRFEWWRRFIGGKWILDIGGWYRFKGSYRSPYVYEVVDYETGDHTITFLGNTRVDSE